MLSSTVVPLYGDQLGYVPKLENSPMSPHPLAVVHLATFAGLSEKVLWSTSRFFVRHRQSSRKGCAATTDGVPHAWTVAFGFTSVVMPVLVLAGDPANRSAFSHATMPDQLSRNTLP